MNSDKTDLVRVHVENSMLNPTPKEAEAMKSTVGTVFETVARSLALLGKHNLCNESYVNECATRLDSLGRPDRNCANCGWGGWFQRRYVCRKFRDVHEVSSPGNSCGDWKPIETTDKDTCRKCLYYRHLDEKNFFCESRGEISPIENNRPCAHYAPHDDAPYNWTIREKRK